MLFQVEVGKNEVEMAQLTLAAAGLRPEFQSFAQDLFAGVEKNKIDLDGYLSKFVKEWDIDRLANVDKIIIQLAMFELLFRQETPANIVINEAVELAKSYGGAEAPAFINAVLDRFYHLVVLEEQADYQVEDSFRELRRQQLAETAAKIQQLAAATEITVAAAPEPQETKKKHTLVFDQEKKVVDGKAYRIIKKEKISADDQIQAENILEDKRRIYGDNAYLTEADIRRALQNGETIPEELLYGAQKTDRKPDREWKPKRKKGEDEAR